MPSLPLSLAILGNWSPIQVASGIPLGSDSGYSGPPTDLTTIKAHVSNHLFGNYETDAGQSGEGRITGRYPSILPRLWLASFGQGCQRLDHTAELSNNEKPRPIIASRMPLEEERRTIAPGLESAPRCPPDTKATRPYQIDDP